MAPKMNPSWTQDLNDAVSQLREDILQIQNDFNEKFEAVMLELTSMKPLKEEKSDLDDTTHIGGGHFAKEDEGNDGRRFRPNFLPKVEIKKFNGTDVRTWITQMEQYFSLHQVPTDKKIPLASLHMETEPYQWYQWVMKTIGGLSYQWEGFVKDLIAQYDSTWDQDHFNQLAKVRQEGTVSAYTAEYQRLSTRVDGLCQDKLLELYIGGLRDDIRHELRLLKPDNISTAINFARHIEAKNKAS